jgi:hypothetical protein
MARTKKDGEVLPRPYIERHQLEKPQAVVDAVDEVLRQLRTKAKP